jgi:glycosyltransferase involved in cell wall biosynthesis
MADESAARGVNLVGFFHAEFGQGEVARRLDAALRHAGFPHRTITHENVPHRQDHPFEHAEGDEYDVNVLCLNAEHLLDFAGGPMGELLIDHYSVGVWFWETNRFPEYLRPALKFVDEVWVASAFVASAIAAETAVPVLTFPLPVTVSAPTNVMRAEIGLPDDRFAFSFVFDFYSTVERKNPVGLIEAFKQAFSPEDGAFLLVKSINGDKHPDELAKVRRATDGRPDIRVVDGFVPAEHVRAYAALSDCTVSLHRSEGFGLTLAEAMAHGKPVIATGYSGNLIFMNDANSFLVPYTLVELQDEVGPYPAGSAWAEPDLAEAARLLRFVKDNPDEARTRAERGRETIATNHSLEATESFLSDRLPTIEKLHAERRLVKTPARLAADYLVRGPQLSWDAPSRLGRPGVWARKAVRRLLRPYLTRQREFEHAVVDSLRELELVRIQEQMRGERLEGVNIALRERTQRLSRRIEELEQRQLGGK